MAKRKDKQYNEKKKGQTIQWPKERTDNTMAKRKDKQYNGQKKLQTISSSDQKVTYSTHSLKHLPVMIYTQIKYTVVSLL
jgi:hypothetical protein